MSERGVTPCARSTPDRLDVSTTPDPDIHYYGWLYVERGMSPDTKQCYDGPLALVAGVGVVAYGRSMNASRGMQLEPLERLVLKLMAHGLSAREVSQRLDVPVDRVRAHTHAAVVKLGAHSKLEALVIAIRRGLIVPPAI